MPITQENRLISISTPLGEDVLLLEHLKGIEGISTLFSFELSLLSETHDISFEQIVGKNVTITIQLQNDNRRYLNGIISTFSQTGSHAEGGQNPNLSHYTATMVPELWILTRTTDIKMFQELSVPDIIEQIFREKEITHYALRLSGTYPIRTYCVQYRETDFNFISRLMEEEGIFYFFEHEENNHTLVLADTPSEHTLCPHQEEASYQRVAGGHMENVITSFDMTQEVRIGKYTLNDFNLEIPATSLRFEAEAHTNLGPGMREVYDFPAEYESRDVGERRVNTRMQEEEARITTINGTGTCKAFTSGYKFRLQDFYREDLNDKEYVILTVYHEVNQSNYRSTDNIQRSEFYRNNFTCIPYEVPFRPPRLTPKPIVEGVQTATVVGPESEEIYTDRFGRVKVKFHWDRTETTDQSSSCWVWVSQIIAGNGWGAMFIPRIGQEVIVDYIEGDPDRPIITGRVYHGINLPPYPLPNEKTKSGIKTYSSPGGEGFNEIRFEDKKGEEQLFIHAEKNQDVRVKNDTLEWIGNDHHLIVKGKQFELIEGNQHLTVKGDQNEKVDGTKSLKVGMDLQEKVGIKYALDAAQEIHLKGGMNVVIEAGMSITLKAGGGFIVVGPAGVTISGTPVLINSGGSAGSGSGCSPTTPELPKEADTAEPGKDSEAAGQSADDSGETAPQPPRQLKQIQTLTDAAQSGKPLCEL